ncbi:uncharacterized protein TrAtP1_000923 [Trichoderma atroviride]|uniref:uncharacterized protein n=1 Tax=Hypocrea atroviridis TaxID=63577 RepID=UPI003328ADF2|nr:hypothetical protein TrAtP1_000923 [Trichoderma atroviride]
MVYLLYLRRAVQILTSDDTAHSAGDVCMLAASRGGEFMTRLETAAHKTDRRAADCGNDFHVASRRLPRISILALGARTTSHVPSLILSACCLPKREGRLAFEASNFGPAAGVAQRRGY